MVVVEFSSSFERRIKKIKNQAIKTKLKKQLKKIIENPEIGKPMRYNRKGSRELYITPFRLSYAYIKKENKVVFLDLYHKNFQ